jgi:signal transduction histidine kinase
VKLRHDRRAAVVSVTDHGQGIDKQDQQRIFERFERATDSSAVSGLGLGLYIARHILHGFGGTLRVESEPGQGATFILELPLGDPLAASGV